jgi:hypothetical protein
LDLNDAESFGDILQAKRDNILHVGFQNIYNLPEDCRTSKRQPTAGGLNGSEGLQLLHDSRNWSEVQEDWCQRQIIMSRSVFAHNVKELDQRKVLQPGGVGLISTEEVTHRITGTGKDPAGLGRWCWTRFQGKNGSFCTSWKK